MDCSGRRLGLVRGGQWHSTESWKTTLGRDLVRKLAYWQPKKGLLTLSQGKETKGHEVADVEDDDDAVRTSVSQDRVTAALCTEELFLSTQYIALTAYQMVNHVGGDGYGWSTWQTWYAQLGLTTSQPDLTMGFKFPKKTGYFSYNFFGLGKVIKPFFYSRWYVSVSFSSSSAVSSPESFSSPTDDRPSPVSSSLQSSSSALSMSSSLSLSSSCSSPVSSFSFPLASYSPLSSSSAASKSPSASPNPASSSFLPSITSSSSACSMSSHDASNVLHPFKASFVPSH